MPDLKKRLNQSPRARLIIAVLLPFALVALVLGTLVALRWVASHRVATTTSPSSQAASPSSPPVPSAAQVAAAPHPPLEASDNPPPTETGRSVIEEEPTAPVIENEPPPPAAIPRESVTVAQLEQPQARSAEHQQEGPAAPPSGEQPVTAATATAPSRPTDAKQPEWLRLAVAAAPANGHPMIAVIIDDMGLDRRRSQEILDLPGPLTISFMSYAQDLPRQLAEARTRGDEIMMHVPMEPLDARMDPGPGVITVKLSQAEIRRTLDADLAKFGGYVGINNHMGSKFTADAAGMEVVMQDLRERGLLFIDSLTSEKSVGLAVARRYGVASAGRNVFLDDAGDLISVEFELGKLEEVARAKGNAIAIGHPRDATIKALAEWLPKVKAKGFILVPVTAIVQARMLQQNTQATR